MLTVLIFRTCSHPSMLDSIVSRLPSLPRKGSPRPPRPELRLAVSRLMCANFS